ncbi:MAG: carotenoid biosynthesis protein [Candidatus Methylomirabilota bacterium]
MEELLRLLAGTVLLRPYVIGFLAVHLVGAGAWLGLRRTAALSLITWAVAFVAEASSIRTGIPFGWYYYIPDTADRELWVLGVPFFDSPSFAFLLTASYGLAWLLLAGNRPAADAGDAMARPGVWRHGLLATGLFVLSDVVTDPVALLGERWFLGKIYGYPEPGFYFGVPMANFIGWGVVGVTALSLYRAWERRRPEMPPGRFVGLGWLCPGLYFMVLAFSLTVTFALGEWRLGLSGLALCLPVLLWTLAALAGSRRAGGTMQGESARA